MNIFSIAGIGIVVTVICIILKQYKPEFAMLVGVIGGIFVFGIILSQISPVFNIINSLLDKLAISNEYTKILFKSLGICYITQLAVDVCSDAGEVAVANKIGLAGKVAILILALPMFNNILDIAFNLIRM